MKLRNYRRLRRTTLMALFALSLLYIGQGVIIRLKLAQLDADRVELEQVSESCDGHDCTATWALTPAHQFLLLGHILRTHRVFESQTGREVHPISRITGTVADAWVRLRVYAVNPGSSYQVIATRPQATRLGYFVGILPRTTNHDGILSVPDIGNTVAMISGLLLASILLVVFSSALLGRSLPSPTRGQEQRTLNVLAISAIFASLAAFISFGFLDTLLPEGDFRTKLLRISTILSLSLPIVAQARWISSSQPILRSVLAATLIVLGALACWPWVRAGYTWAGIMTALIVVGAVAFIRMRLWLAAGIWALYIFDAAKIAGIFQIYDHPPIYVGNVSIFLGLTLVAGDLGGFATIAMAGVAYRRFKRDLVLAAMQQAVERSSELDSVARLSGLRAQLADIAALTGAGQVTMTISLPLGRPVTLSYDRGREESHVYDDGRIPGAVTLRCLVYGDEAMFESFDEFAARLRLPQRPQYLDSKYFCSVALRVNQTIVGTMMLTKFADDAIARLQVANPLDFLQEERETIVLVGSRLSQSLSTLMVQNLDATTSLSRELQTMVRGDIAGANGIEDFLARFAASISRSVRVKVMIHERVDDRAMLCSSYGLTPAEDGFFDSNPLNLAKDAAASYGPTVVAFREGKSSYVRDIGSILDLLHPKTQTILRAMAATCIGAVPLQAADRSFVVTLVSSPDLPVPDPASIAVVESTEALFVAAIEVMSQKASVFALGRLASRLIGDAEVREKILLAAKADDLPTIVGSVRESFLLLFDLAGSSELPDETESKAKAYGLYYDAVNRAALQILGGAVRKTIGDAVIITWDGTDIRLSEDSDILPKLMKLVALADETARSIGCRGARAILHFGKYFFGLIGTQTFGQIDVIGRGIDEVCKIEAHAKHVKVAGQATQMAISPQAVAMLPLLHTLDYQQHGFQAVPGDDSERFAIAYAASRPRGHVALISLPSSRGGSDAA